MLNLEEMKSEYINKTFNKLTVIDVFRSSNKAVLFKCRCECGAICDKDFRKVISGHTKTCGGHIHHIEHANKMSQLYKDNPELGKAAGAKISQWYKDNPEKVAKRSEGHKKWWADHVEQREYQSNAMSCRMHDKFIDFRVNADYSSLLEIIHPKYVNDLLSGNIVSSTLIETKCPSCGKYGIHKFHDIFVLSDSKLKYDHALLCKECQRENYSHYEQEIADYISTFYSGKCVRNSREIISPLELDLYYPEKKIAIEFNGDYFHNEDHKQADYHFNKFKMCYDKRITLVSIFEKSWNDLKDSIISYLHDLFNDKQNSLSFINERTINLNYPIPDLNLFNYNVVDDYYVSKGIKVYMCGNASERSQIKDLNFLVELADKNSLEHFINNKGDLEIKDKNICFHLADLLCGENDAYERWKEYHDNNIRCVFVYPPYLNDTNRVNIYKNILLYHCGLTKRVYARNTVIAKYPAIKMKQFFIENNIEGYRNAKTAYVLEDKNTHEPLMCYLIGHSFFGKGNYDCEIARGACKLGIQVVGGASKLWKHIIQDSPDIKSIVYYCDRREYDQRSIGHLMDSAAMKGLGHVYTFNNGHSFMNYWVNDTYFENRIWHKAGEYKNREPDRHKYVMKAIRDGDCIAVKNPGSFTNIFVRNGYCLDGMKVVPNDH